MTAARADEPAVVLLDIGLPGMDGYQVAQRLRQQASKPPPFIALTGYEDEALRRRSGQEGIYLHLLKPVHSRLL